MTDLDQLLAERERIIHDLMSGIAQCIEEFSEAFYRITDNMVQKPGLRGQEFNADNYTKEELEAMGFGK